MSSPDPGSTAARLIQQLREVHRLSTSFYESTGEIYAAYLATGREVFSMPYAAVLGLEGQVIEGDAVFTPSIRADVDLPGQGMGALAFGSGPACGFDLEIVEMMARGLSHGLLEIEAIRQQKRLMAEREWQAWHDPLTNLPNRSRLAEWIGNAIARAEQDGGRVGLLFVDLDRLKPINDTLGHGIGDQVLVAVASRISGVTRQSDRAVRLGADEFVLLVPGISKPDDAAEIARRLLDALRQPFAINGYELFLTASIGISLYPDHGRNEQSLIQAADAAMYRAKNRGRNDFRIFSAEFAGQQLDRWELENQLRRALENDELELQYQPIRNLDGSLDSLEVLLAWQSPRFGRLSAAQFIDIAEETGMIVTIGPWVLREACTRAAVWLQEGHRARVAVNVSALQFARRDFAQSVSDILNETGLPAQLLQIEITESTLLRDIGDTARSLSRLRELGISVAIDDFGTGYSSLSYLNRLPVDSLKIDQSFLAELDSNATSAPLVRAIVLMAHSIGLAVIAEGVETEHQLGLLRAVGCDKAQGHLLGAALPAAEVSKLLCTTPAQ